MRQRLIYNQDYVIRVTHMPAYIHGAVVLDEEGRSNIYLNEDDPDERKLRTVKHEILHIVRGDLYRESSGDEDCADEVEQIEKKTRRWEKLARLRIISIGNK